MSSRIRPQAVVIGGPNGAGKTSAAPDLLRDTIGIDAFVNADMIAAGLAGFGPASAAIEAGRVMIRRLRGLVEAGTDLAFESTLSGKSVATLLRGAKSKGYEVRLLYIWLASPEIAIARVRRRVAEGGHDVPEADVVRRFGRSLMNFERVYRPLATSWRVYDGNPVGLRKIVAYGRGSEVEKVVDADAWAAIQDQVGGTK